MQLEGLLAFSTQLSVSNEGLLSIQFLLPTLSDSNTLKSGI
jgi:hypothetical protein